MRLCHVLAIGDREWRAALVVSMGDVAGQGFLVGSTERVAYRDGLRTTYCGVTPAGNLETVRGVCAQF